MKSIFKKESLLDYKLFQQNNAPISQFTSIYTNFKILSLINTFGPMKIMSVYKFQTEFSSNKEIIPISNEYIHALLIRKTSQLC